MNRERNLIKNTIIIAFGTFLPKLSSIITLPIITAGLTKAEYGTYDLISTLVSLFLPLVTLQMQSAAFRFLIDCREDRDKTKSVITNIFIFIIPMSVISLLVLYFCLINLSLLIRLLICFYFFADILLITLQQVIRGLLNNKLYSASAVIQALINMLLIMATVFFAKQGLVGVLTSTSIATLIGVGFLIIKAKILLYIDFSFISKEKIFELLAYSWPMIPNSLSNWVLSLSDRLVLTVFMGIETNAIYAVANKIPSLFSTVQGTFVFAWQENASIASKDNDAAAYYSSMFDNILRILVGIMALLIAATPILFQILIRGDYNGAYYQMPILFIGMLFSSLASFMGGIYIAHKKTRSVGVTTILAAIFNLLIDLACVRYIGIFAASISTLLSFMLLAIYRMWDVQKFQRMEYNIPQFIILISGLIFMCILCFINNFKVDVLNLVIGIVFASAINKDTIIAFFSIFKMKIKRK